MSTTNHYANPLVERYCSPEMSFIFSADFLYCLCNKLLKFVA